MSTTTVDAIELDDAEVEALRHAAFDAIETQRTPTRPADDADIPEAIAETIGLRDRITVYASALQMAQSREIWAEALADDAARSELALLLQATVVKLGEMVEYYRRSPLEDPRQLEGTLAAATRLLRRIVAIAGEA